MAKQQQKPKVYYTVDLSVSWHQVCWIDLSGQKHQETLQVEADGVNSHLDLVHTEFKRQHPGAVYLTNAEMLNRLAWLDLEKEKVAAWNAWAKS